MWVIGWMKCSSEFGVVWLVSSVLNFFVLWRVEFGDFILCS